MRFIRFVMSTILACTALACAAGATIFQYDYIGATATGSGYMVAAWTGSGYQVTGIIGTANGSPISFLYDPLTYAGNSNLIYPSSPKLDSGGISFNSLTAPYNLYYDTGVHVGPGYAICTLCFGADEQLLTTFHLLQVGGITYDFSFTGPNGGGAGQIVATPGVGGQHLIDNISGSVFGEGITGLYSPRTFHGNDNLIGSGNPALDFGGFSFTTTANGYNIYYDTGVHVGPGYAFCSICGGADERLLENFTLKAVPEPGSLAVVAAGIALVRRRRGKARFTG